MSHKLLKDQKGSALIVTLLIVALLVGLVVDFVYETYIDSASLSNWTNAQKATLLAKSGHAFSANFIERIEGQEYKTMQYEELPVPYYFGPGSYVILRVEDESAKFDVNSIIQGDGTEHEKNLERLKKLFEYLNINSDVALEIADWIDKDLAPRLANSENISKNAPLWSLDELKLIDGIDEEVFNKISPFITVYRTSENLISQVNINTAPLEVLYCLHEDMTEELAKKIIRYREENPFSDKSKLKVFPIFDDTDLYSVSAVKHLTLRVTSTARVNEITRIIESVMDTKKKIHFWRET